ncbi:MAG: hypothetical protein HY897_19925 [Deltaproteobacteria bacterium]|nr:hypothetical protein [Deltaproteobacteria bacterium]
MLVVVALLFVSCGQNTPGSFNLTFVWPEGEKPDFSKVSLYAWAKLQRWPGGDQAAASTLSEAGPAKLGDAAQRLTLGDLTYGGERVVVVEIRGSEQKSGAVLYFGASDLFAIEAGKTTEVAVRLALQPGPALEKPVVKILHNGEEKAIVPSASVTLRLTLANADTVTIANDPAFSAGKAELPIVLLKALGGNEYEWPGAWDLNVGLQGTGDGQRSVFVKSTNVFGHSSESGQDTVTLDTVPPTMVASGASPDPAGNGFKMVYTVGVSETLSGSPGRPVAKVFKDSIEQIGFFGDRVSETETSFTYNKLVTAGMDGIYTVKVDLEDQAGNVSTGLDGAGFTLDTINPAVAALAVSPGRVKSGQTVAVTFTAGEALADDPIVKLGSLAMKKTAPNGFDYTYEYTTTGEEGDGTRSVSVQLVDAAGNTGGEVFSGQSEKVEFDFTPPQVVSSVASPSLAALNREVVFQATIDEPLAPGSAPKLVTTPAALAWTDAEVEGSSYRWKHTAQAGESGTYAVAIDQFCDDLGNCAENVALSTGVAIDADAPVLKGAAELFPAPDARVKTGVEVRLNVNVEENMGLATGFPRARIGGKEMPPARAPDRGWAYTFAYLTDETKDVEGAQTVVLDLADAAGNAKTETVGLVTFDFKKPEVLSAGPSNPTYKLSDTILYTINASEPLAGSPARPTVKVFKDGNEQPAFFGDPIQETETSFTYAKAVTSGMDGAFTVRIDLTDRAGNEAAGDAGDAFSVDSTEPTVSSVTASPERIDETGTVSIVFDCIEDVGTSGPGLDVRIGGRLVTACDRTGDAPAVHYTCAYAMTGNETAPGSEGAQMVVVSAADAAGNASTGSGSVVFDFKDPAVATATVAYVPEGTNPLSVVSKAKAGTRITVTVIADEALDTGVAPAMTATKDSTTLTFGMAAGSFSPGGVTFEAVVPQGAADGVYAPSVTWTDAAGNAASSATFSDPPIIVKTSTPALTIKQGQVRYLRSPLGNAAPENLGNFAVPAGAYFALGPADPLENADALPADTFSFDAGASPLKIRVWADDKKQALLGAAIPNGDGSWPRQQLANLDTLTVFVTGLDEAGNESIPKKVTNAQWVATANQPAYGNSPHEFRRTRYADPSQSQNPSATDEPGAGAEGADATAVLARAETAWRERALSQAKPSARSQFGMAYDSARGRTIVFGGWDAANRRDTWEWDGTAWTEKLPQGDKPSARNMHALAYDSARGRVVLFGGYDGADDQQDLWEWDGVEWLKKSSGGGPWARLGHAMAYHSGRRAVMLFGGKASALQNDTWEWDGTNWTPQSSAGKPSARWGHAMVYDSARGVLVLFGGNDGTNRQDTWEWDGSAWTQKTPAGSVPPPRTSHRMAYDARRKKTVLFGGIDGTAIRRDVWEWDGTAWVEKALPAGDPRGAYEHGMAYDAVRGRVLLFGGVTDIGLVQGMWEWDGERWTESRGDRPVPRYNHAMSYDPDRKKVVLFGGRNDVSYQDTWEWDGAGWSNRTPGGQNPSQRHDSALAYDKVRKKTVLFGGADGLNLVGDTWEWDGSAWEQKSPASNPSARMGHALAFDAERGLVVMFGGGLFPLGQQDTWEWDGVDWAQASPASSPPARSMHAMTWDGMRKRVLVVGGYNLDLFTQRFYDDVWEWDGAEWRDASPAQNRPQARYRHAVAFDDDRGRMILFGGFYDNRFNDTWEWDGSAWTNKTPSKTIPSVRLGHAMVYDSANKRTVMFGGAGGSDDTWEYDAGEGRTPAIQFDVSAMGAGIDEGMITGLRVRAHAGGVFWPYDASSKGAALFGWAGSGPGVFPGEWLPLASNATGVNPANPYLPAPNAALIDWPAQDLSVALQYFIVRDRAMSFQIRPAGSSGPGANEAQVAVDYLEVRINYLAP